MTSDSKPQRRQSRRRPASEAFILMAMTLVSAAAGFGLYLQFGLGLLGSGITALAIYVGLVSAHALVRRSEAIRELSYEVDRLENEVMRIARGGGPVLPMPPVSDQQQHNRPGLPPVPGGMAQVGRPQSMARPGPGVAPLAGPAAELAGHSPGGYQSAAPSTQPQAAAQPARPSAQDGQARPSVVVAGSMPAPQRFDAPDQHAAAASAGRQPADPMARYWAVRPVEPVIETSRSGASGSGAPMHRQPGAAATHSAAAKPEQMGSHGSPSRREAGGDSTASSDVAEGADTVEGDVDVINDMIRKFSEEFGVPDPKSRTSNPSSPAGKAVDKETLSQEEAVISASVGALRAAAGEMRRPNETGPTAIERGILPPLRIDPESDAPKPPPVGPGHAQIAAIADAITTQKMDVYLEPILGLVDRKARHYEISLRLRMGPGPSIGPEQYVAIARNSGMMPAVDAARAARAAMVARHLDERGSAGCVFSSISAESLGSERFLSEFAEACRQAPKLRERLVFSVRQSELRGLSPAQWTTIKQLAGSGFRFAIEDVTSLDLDLPDLRSAGFAFMRVSARALIDGISSLDGPVPAAELCRRLAGTGLTLMAVGLEGEEQLDGVLGGGVPLGQGPLFGMPRPVKAEALRPASSAAA